MEEYVGRSEPLLWPFCHNLPSGYSNLYPSYTQSSLPSPQGMQSLFPLWLQFQAHSL